MNNHEEFTRYPFDLERALAGEEVITRDGRACTGLKEAHRSSKIVEFYIDGIKRDAYKEDGAQHSHGKAHEIDLFMRHPAKFKSGMWVRLRNKSITPAKHWLVVDHNGDWYVKDPDGGDFELVLGIADWEPVTPTREVTTWIRKYLDGNGTVGFMTSENQFARSLADDFWQDVFEWRGEAYSETHEVDA